MLSTKFWIICIALLLCLSTAASVFVLYGNVDARVAKIYQNGTCIDSIDLSSLDQRYTLEITGAVTNTIAVEPGRICVLDATCRDQICVSQGWISSGVIPIVCLPNALVIQVEGALMTGSVRVSEDQGDPDDPGNTGGNGDRGAAGAIDAISR